MTLRESLIAQGLVVERCQAVRILLAKMRHDADRAIGRAQAIVERIQRREKFTADLPKAMSQDRRNPATSGSLPSEARMRGAAGHDSRGKYKLSGPATKPGMVYNASARENQERMPCNTDTCDRHKHDPKTAR